MDPPASLIGIITLLSFAFIAAEELPFGFNIKRVERRVRRTARRKSITEPAALLFIRRQTKWGAWTLLGFALACFAFVVSRVLADPVVTPEFLVIAGSMVLGLVLLGFAFLLLAPRLFDKVENRMSASATPNSFAADAEAPHGAGPRL